MTGSGGITADYYRRRLEEFLAERHPQLTGARELVATRSNRAYAVYRTTLARVFATESHCPCRCPSCTEGLIFSRYDLLRDILATDYPQIPEYQLRPLALGFATSVLPCSVPFNLNGILQRREYGTLMALREFLQEYVSQHGLFVRLRGRPRNP